MLYQNTTIRSTLRKSRDFYAKCCVLVGFLSRSISASPESFLTPIQICLYNAKETVRHKNIRYLFHYLGAKRFLMDNAKSKGLGFTGVHFSYVEDSTARSLTKFGAKSASPPSSPNAGDDGHAIYKVYNPHILPIFIQQYPVICLYNNADQFHAERYAQAKSNAVP